MIFLYALLFSLNSITYWLNLQREYDSLLAAYKSDQELIEERKVFAQLDYTYFQNNFFLPDVGENTDDKIQQIREFLNIATLCVLCKRDMSVSFRSTSNRLTESDIIKANTMVQIATNQALNHPACAFNKNNFEKAVSQIKHAAASENFLLTLQNIFNHAGVCFSLIPDLCSSPVKGATKKVSKNVVLMINEKEWSSDTFLFTLFHEIGHILHGDYGISFEKESGAQEEAAGQYAKRMLSIE